MTKLSWFLLAMVWLQMGLVFVALSIGRDANERAIACENKVGR